LKTTEGNKDITDDNEAHDKLTELIDFYQKGGYGAEKLNQVCKEHLKISDRNAWAKCVSVCMQNAVTNRNSCESQPWFWGDIKKFGVETIFNRLTYLMEGTFLVRYSSKIGNYVLEINDKKKQQKGKQHQSFRIIQTASKKWCLDGQEEGDDSLSALIERTMSSAVIESKEKTAVTLHYPLRNTSIRHARDIKHHLRQMRECGQFSRLDLEHFPDLDSYSNWIDLEWQQLYAEEKGYKQFNAQLHEYKTTTAGDLNSKKNRYDNIIPYDWSRAIILYGQPEKEKQVKHNQPGMRPNDRKYINANHVGNRETQNRGRTYIAAQGPIGQDEASNSRGKKVSTIEDFWCMVATKKPKFILAAVNLMEGGRQKCGQYWPNKGNITTFRQDNGDEYLKIHNKEEEVSPNGDWVRRRILVQPLFSQQIKIEVGQVDKDKLKDEEKIKEAAAFEVNQYQFLKWPDHGVIEQVDVFVEFITQLHEMYEKEADRHNRYDDDNNNNKGKKERTEEDSKDYNFIGSRGAAGPLIVHCSAGVGRTGTIIAIDMILDRIRWFGLDTDIDIYKTIQKIREHRPDMVQSKEQYEFIYKAVECFVESFILRSQTPEEREKDELQNQADIDVSLEQTRFKSRRHQRTIKEKDTNNN